jgi:uncharacterized membrane protein YebE (DUF533 family)
VNNPEVDIPAGMVDWTDEREALRAEVERLRRENDVLRWVLAMTDPCIHQEMVEAQQDGQTMSLEEYMASRGIGSDKTAGAGE